MQLHDHWVSACQCRWQERSTWLEHPPMGEKKGKQEEHNSLYLQGPQETSCHWYIQDLHNLVYRRSFPIPQSYPSFTSDDRATWRLCQRVIPGVRNIALNPANVLTSWWTSFCTKASHLSLEDVTTPSKAQTVWSHLKHEKAREVDYTKGVQ